MNLGEAVSLIFILTNLLFFTFNGGLPRHIIVTLPFVMMFASIGIVHLKRRLRYLVLTIVLIISLLLLVSFIINTNKGYNNAAAQHDFEGAVNFIIHDTDIKNSTVITSRLKDMAFEFSIRDKKRVIFLREFPKKKEDLNKLLYGEFLEPLFITERGTSEKINFDLIPPASYLVIHEGYETGSVKDLINYNSKKYVESLENFYLLKIINSTKTNSKTWIYKKS